MTVIVLKSYNKDYYYECYKYTFSYSHLHLWLEFLWRNRCTLTIPAILPSCSYSCHTDLAETLQGTGKPFVLRVTHCPITSVILYCPQLRQESNGEQNELLIYHASYSRAENILAVHSWVGRKHEEKCYLQALGEKKCNLKKSDQF